MPRLNCPARYSWDAGQIKTNVLKTSFIRCFSNNGSCLCCCSVQVIVLISKHIPIIGGPAWALQSQPGRNSGYNELFILQATWYLHFRWEVRFLFWFFGSFCWKSHSWFKSNFLKQHNKFSFSTFKVLSKRFEISILPDIACCSCSLQLLCQYFLFVTWYLLKV